MATYKTIVTLAGKALITAAEATGVPIELAMMGVGDGNGNPTTPSETQTALVRQVYSSTLNSIGVDPSDATQFKAELVVPADTGGFTIREVGLYTVDGTLFAVANTPQVYKPSASEGAYSDATVVMNFKVSNAGTVNVVVDPNISIATRTWVINYATAANILPGGLTNQFLAKHSNTDGDTQWVDPSAGIQVIVDTVEEKQTLAAGQTVVDLASLTTNATAIYIEGVRLPEDEWTATTSTRVTLGQAYPDGTVLVAVQNEQTGQTDVLRSANNLTDVASIPTARVNLGAAARLLNINTGVGLTGGGNLTADRTIAVDFATSGTSSVTQAVRADDVRLSDARTPLPHNQAASTITGQMTAAQGGTGLATLTAGSFLVGNGTGNVTLRTPPQVLSDIGAASASHTHNIADVNGLQTALDSKAPLANPVFSGAMGSTGPSFVLTNANTNAVYVSFNNTLAGSRSWAIGTSGGLNGPNGNLFVLDNTSGSVRLSIDSGGTVTANQGFSSQLYTVTGVNSGIVVQDRNNVFSTATIYEQGGAFNILGSFLNTNLMTLQQTTGSVSFLGSVTCTTMNASSSDINMKEDIDWTAAPRALHRDIAFTEYTWKEGPLTGKRWRGPIAQDVQKTDERFITDGMPVDGKPRLAVDKTGIAYEEAMWCGNELDRQAARIAELEQLVRQLVEAR